MSKSCCTIENQAPNNIQEQSHNDHDHDHQHGNSEQTTLQLFLPAICSFLILILGIILDYYQPIWYQEWIRLCIYIIAYIPVGFPVIKEAIQSIRYSDFFSEFFLMSIATIGAFAIGEYPEGVAVMLFYSVGEAFQGMAVSKAKSNIKNLLDSRPDEVTIIENNQVKIIKAEHAQIGQIIQLKPGEKLALDGELVSSRASFNTSALTGESKPNTKEQGEIVLAGMINLQQVAEIKISTSFKDSKLSRILELVQNATTKKAKTELFIRKFAKIYTPIVVFLAIAITILPYFFVGDYIFKDWLYKALIFLVISCPCALVISIPLGYFGGIGAGSQNGILFKGGNYLDVLSSVNHVVMDKTGTLTEGVFKVKEVKIGEQYTESEVLELVNVLESKTSHPIATAIKEYVGETNSEINFEHIEEIPGHGLKGITSSKEILVGNFKLLTNYNIEFPSELLKIHDTIIAIAINQNFVGYITIADQIKDSAQKTINTLKQMGISTTMLSGDKKTVVEDVAQSLNIDHYFGDLLPEDKVNEVQKLKNQDQKIAFVGDGINDAPVVALSDVGMAMGGLGSDATIEIADVVIQDDDPYKIPMAIKISKATRQIVWQNITLAFGVKAAVMILGVSGHANMWEAVFADVGVALLAILNAVRIQKMNFRT